MKRISIVTPCFNESTNIYEVYVRVKNVFQTENSFYQYEHIFIDNCSTDNTREILKSIAAKDKNIKLIFNSRNFGHIRSPYHALLQSTGDATILLVSDLQDPPELIPKLIAEWEHGYRIVKCVKNISLESKSMFFIRKLYYNFLNRLSEIHLTKNFTGFGLYDKTIIEILKNMDDPYPYFRGLLSEIGFQAKEIYFTQPTRKRGITKNNFYTLYDIAMLGVTEYSKIPLRFCTLLGFFSSLVCLIITIFYILAKIVFWNNFSLGTAPTIIGLFFVGAIQLFCTGLLGEYIGSIHTKIQKRPLVIEEERINFEGADTSL